LLDSIFDAIQDLIIVVDKDRRVLMSNWKSPGYTGDTKDPGTPHCYEAFIHRDVPCESCHALESFETGKAVWAEYFNPFTKRYSEIQAYPIFDDSNKVIMVTEHVHDVTERKQAHDLLLTKTMLLEAQSETSLDGILAVNNEGHSILSNKHFSEVWKIPAHILTSKNDATMLEYVSKQLKDPGEFDRKVAYLYERHAEKSRDEIELVDGRYLDRYSSPLLSVDGQYLGRIWFFRDITDSKKSEEKLRKTLESLRKAFDTIVKVMISTVEVRDPYTAGHQSRSADIACAIAIEMGFPQDKIVGIHMAGSIHDIGKLSIPAEILSKPTKLSKVEFTLIKEHSQSGYEILKNVESPWPLAQIAYQHHERMNGSGYPRNLRGDEILMEARILAVADVVESMASHRPYRPALGIEAALEEIERNKGILYDESVADACLRLFREKCFKLEGT
jgi:HD-GYP domain-containing protein (c-di-GMP phosphodiesterase class II)